MLKESLTKTRRPIICPSGKIIAHDKRYVLTNAFYFNKNLKYLEKV